jgi:transcriptional antiterminator RfaH
MPILAADLDLYPPELFRVVVVDSPSRWWALYSMSRQEKRLMRWLHAQQVPFYCPLIPKRNRSPAGRIRVSHVPLFSNYVFVLADEEQRHAALKSNCVSRCLLPPDAESLVRDLDQIRRLIATGAPLAAERRLEAGTLVRIRSGSFKDFEGIILRREKETRLLVAVNFLQQGASVLLEDCQLERIG